jgi:hypothetical protein
VVAVAAWHGRHVNLVWSLIVMVTWYVVSMATKCGCHGNMSWCCGVESRQSGVIIMETWCYVVVLVIWCDCHGIQVWLS